MVKLSLDVSEDEEKYFIFVESSVYFQFEERSNLISTW
jgi:hypothetical protein